MSCCRSLNVAAPVPMDLAVEKQLEYCSRHTLRTIRRLGAYDVGGRGIYNIGNSSLKESELW